MTDTSNRNALNLEFARKFPDAFARVLAQAEVAEVLEILEQLPPAVASSLVARLPRRAVDVLLVGGGNPELWLAAATFDDAVALLGRLPRQRSLVLVNGLQDRKMRRRLLQFLNYPAHSVGGLVSDVMLQIPGDMPVADVLAELRAQDRARTPPVVVLDGQGRYAGILSLWALLVREPFAGCARDYLVQTPPLRPETPLSSAVEATQWQSRGWLPVVDHEGRVLGSIDRQRVIDTFTSTFAEKSPVVAESIGDLIAQLVRVMTELVSSVLSPRSMP